MKNKIVSLILFSFFLANPFVSAEATDSPQISTSEENSDLIGEAKQILIEEGFKIPVALKQSINSGKASEGEKVEGEVKADVIINDRIVIKKGTPVKGYITQAQRAGKKGKGGNLSFVFTSVKAVDNQKISLRAGSSRSGSSGRNFTFMVMSPVPVGLLAPISRGSNATFGKGALINAYTEEEITITSNLLPNTDKETEEQKAEKPKKRFY